MHQIEFFFDCSSPWTYLAFESILELRTRHEFDLVWRPILVGGVFNTVNPSVYENRAKPVPVKARYYQKDLNDWARHVGITIGQPPVFPVNSVKVMRGAFVAIEQDCLVPYARAVFRSYWTDLADVSQDDVIGPILETVGLDPQHYFDQIAQPAIKNQLRANTDELMTRGGFGSPTLFLDGDDMYFGNDRIPLLAGRLAN